MYASDGTASSACHVWLVLYCVVKVLPLLLLLLLLLMLLPATGCSSHTPGLTTSQLT
jgi:hypothetical protein